MNKFCLLVLAATAVLGASGEVCVGLTEAQRHLIIDSWDLAKRDGHLAPKTFLRLFKAHPEYQKLFAKFADVPLEDLETNGDFLAQAYTVTAGLNVVVESLNSDLLLAQQLIHLGVSHKPRGIKAWHLDEFARSLVETLKEELGSALTPMAVDAWIDGLNALNKAIVANLKDRYDVADPETNLTPQQVKVVQQSWASVRDGREKLAQEVFMELFSDHPSYQQLFPKFAGVNAADLPGNAEFQKQAKQVVDRLDVIVDNLDNDLVLVGQLIYLGHTHFPRRVNREHFTHFGTDLIQALGKRGVSEADRAVWSKVLATLLSQVIDNLH